MTGFSISLKSEKAYPWYNDNNLSYKENYLHDFGLSSEFPPIFTRSRAVWFYCIN